MSTHQPQSSQLDLDDFINDTPTPEPAETTESAESEFERITGVTTVTQEQTRDTGRVVDDSVREDAQRATMDGHDYSDCGGEN